LGIEDAVSKRAKIDRSILLTTPQINIEDGQVVDDGSRDGRDQDEHAGREEQKCPNEVTAGHHCRYLGGLSEL
jgi:hypothetical protein